MALNIAPSLPMLPIKGVIETRAILKKLARAHQALAELKGVAASMPNQSILISTLSLQEAKDSSEIENIITTHDDLYRSDSDSQRFITLAAKEDAVVGLGILSKHRLVKENYYLNDALFNRLANVNGAA